MAQKFFVGVKALITDDKNQVLVLRVNANEMYERQFEHWDLPGGRIEEGDAFENTLHREIKEELGIEGVKILELFDAQISNMKIPTNDGWTSLLLLTYKCKLPNEKVEFKLSSEHLEYRWVSIEETQIIEN